MAITCYYYCFCNASFVPAGNSGHITWVTVVDDRFYIALFSILEQTHYVFVACSSK